MQRIILLFLLLPTIIFGQKNDELASEIKAEFLHAYNGYKSFAGGMDALKPKAKVGYNEFYKSFYLSELECYSTLKIMGLEREATEAKDSILQKLHFREYVNVPTSAFGSRVIGALLSAYQLDGDPRFLDLATDLANRLLPAFKTPTKMPMRLTSVGRRASKEKLCTPSQVAELIVEFGLLSKLTGNKVYYAKAKEAALSLWEKRSDKNLLGSRIDVMSGEWLNRSTSVIEANSGYWGAMLRAYLLLGDQDCKKIWQEGIKALKEHTLLEEDGKVSFRYTRFYNLSHNDLLYQYSEINMASLLALGGQYDLAEKTYAYCKSQLGTLVLSPELKDLTTGKWTRPVYGLRSEQVEAAYFLSTYVQKENYANDAERFFRALKEKCKTKNGYTSLKDAILGKQGDRMPPYLLSRNFKFLYLTFGKTKLNLEEVVFSAHGQPLFVAH